MIKNAEFSGYYFCMKANIKEDFQTFINVPLLSIIKLQNN